MIEMCLVGEQDFDIGEMEAKCLDMSSDQRVGSLYACVDQDVPGRGRDEIAGQLFGTHIIEVARYSERGIVADPAGLDARDGDRFLSSGIQGDDRKTDQDCEKTTEGF